MNWIDYTKKIKDYNEIEIEIPDFEFFLATLNRAFFKQGFIILEIENKGNNIFSFKYTNIGMYNVKVDKLVDKDLVRNVLLNLKKDGK